MSESIADLRSCVKSLSPRERQILARVSDGMTNREIARQLLLEGGALQVDDAQQLAQALKELFADAERRIRVGASGRRVIEVNRGSVARLMEWLEPLVGDLPRRE